MRDYFVPVEGMKYISALQHVHWRPWDFILTNQFKWMQFDIGIMKRMFQMEDVTGAWNALYYNEIRNLYNFTNTFS
jgi:hypothetical protein